MKELFVLVDYVHTAISRSTVNDNPFKIFVGLFSYTFTGACQPFFIVKVYRYN